MDTAIWRDLYAGARVPALPDTFTGFNVNLDRVIPVTRGLLDSPLLAEERFSSLRQGLLASMEQCTAAEWIVPDPDRFSAMVRAFAHDAPSSLGGQAGIAAIRLKGMGAGRVVCMAPYHGSQSAAILERSGVEVPAFPARTGPGDGDFIHLIFEYPAGLVPKRPGTVRRGNRFIVSPVHPPASVLVPEGCMDTVLSGIRGCSRAFLSGFQYLGTDPEFAAARDQLRRMKEQDPSLRIHAEAVSAGDRQVLAGIGRQILPAADSLGANENELRLLLDALDIVPKTYAGTGPLTPVQAADGALLLCRELGLLRIHIHAYGYYLLVRRNTPGSLKSRNALLVAASEAARAAGGDSAGFVREGLAAVRDLEAAFGSARQPGIMEADSCTIIAVPTLISRGNVRTVGLGDILSSTAFAADIF